MTSENKTKEEWLKLCEKAYEYVHASGICNGFSSYRTDGSIVREEHRYQPFLKLEIAYK